MILTHNQSTESGAKRVQERKQFISRREMDHIFCDILELGFSRGNEAKGASKAEDKT